MPRMRSSQMADLWKLAMHELGHGLGFKHIPATNPGVVADGGCIMAIPSTNVYASGPCDVEMQMIYYIYGFEGQL